MLLSYKFGDYQKNDNNLKLANVYKKACVVINSYDPVRP